MTHVIATEFKDAVTEAYVTIAFDPSCFGIPHGNKISLAKDTVASDMGMTRGSLDLVLAMEAQGVWVD